MTEIRSITTTVTTPAAADVLEGQVAAGGNNSSFKITYANLVTTPVAASNATADAIVTAAYIAADAAATTQAALGAKIWPTTPAETLASVTPVNFYLQPGWVERYQTNTTPGTTNMSVGLQAAIDQSKQAGGVPARLEQKTYAFASTLIVGSGVSLIGAGRQLTILNYTGAAQGFKSITPGTRIFNVVIRDLSLTDVGTGTIGVDMDSMSTCDFSNLNVTSWDTGIKIISPTSGFSVYNRFYNVLATSCTTGWQILATSSNANTFIACRGNACTTGAIITDSNQNHFESCQFEGCTTAVSLTASGASLCVRNFFTQCRFESNTNNVVIGANVADTTLIMNYHVNGVVLTDSGTRTQSLSVLADNDVLKLDSAMGGAAGVPYTFKRSGQGGTNGPCVKITDSVTGVGTPYTLQIENERGVGRFISCQKSAAELAYINAGGQLMLSGAATTVAAGQVSFGGTTSASGTAGGVQAVPATVAGYLVINVAGTNMRVPYFTV